MVEKIKNIVGVNKLDKFKLLSKYKHLSLRN